jgi:hypothetical protein
MKNFFLKLSTKNALFLVFLFPGLVQLILVNLAQRTDDLKIYYSLFLFFWLMYLPFFWWLNISVDYLHSQSKNYFNFKIKYFKLSIILNIVSLMNFVFFVSYIFSFLIVEGKPNKEIFLYIFLIQFIGVISFVYSSNFVTMLIKSIDLKRKVKFTEVFGISIFMLIPPYAIWIIHNQVKELMNNKKVS